MDTHDPSDREYLASFSAFRSLLSHRLVLLDSLTSGDFESIGTGIVFVHAPWSSQARIALRTIANLLCDEKFGNLSLNIVSCDKADLGPEVFPNVRYGGYGETLWLKNGQVLFIGSDYSESDLADLRAAAEKLSTPVTEIIDGSLARRNGA
jgi:hypothetical protein